jgi:hypothetical protein
MLRNISSAASVLTREMASFERIRRVDLPSTSFLPAVHPEVRNGTMQSASDDPRSQCLRFGAGLGQRAIFGDERVKPPARVTGAFPKTS